MRIMSINNQTQNQNRPNFGMIKTTSPEVVKGIRATAKGLKEAVEGDVTTLFFARVSTVDRLTKATTEMPMAERVVHSISNEKELKAITDENPMKIDNWLYD